MRLESAPLPKLCLLLLSALTLFANQPSSAGEEDDPAGGIFIPTGVRITPTAAPGSLFQPLNPGLSSDPSFTAGQAATTAVSPDGKTLLILTSGYNSQNFSSGPQLGNTNPAESNEYIFVFDISALRPLQLQVLQVPNAFDGLAWSANGREFHVSGGPDDNVHTFRMGAGGWEESVPPVALGHGQALGLGSISPGAMGLAVTADSKRLVVVNYENDSLSLIDLTSRAKVAELDLRPGQGTPGGEFPVWVAIQGNRTAFVSSARDREVVVVDISTNTPVVSDRIPLKGQPTRLILNHDQTRLYVAESSRDAVAVIATGSHKVVGEVNTTAPKSVFPNSGGYKGSSPNSLALSPDEERLYVTNGGANSLAVVRLGGGDDEVGEVIGLIPTGWYPNSVSVSADGATLYVVNGKSNAGPNPQNCRDAASLQPGGNENACNGANQYVWQLTKAGFLTLPAPPSSELEDLTEQVARNNRYRSRGERESDEGMKAFLRSHIEHVIYIVKENRTYDQILGDLSKGNGDPSIVVYPKPLTPNQHALAEKFVDLDNFYDSGEVSGDGWNWSTSARAADTIEKTEPINYAGRGLNYDYEGTNRNLNVGYGNIADRQAANPLTPADPNLLPGSADVSAPDSAEGEEGAGYLWNAALRAGLRVRNYGFFIDLARYSIPASFPGFIPPTLTDPFASGTKVAFPTKAALQAVTDPYFRGYDNKFPDFYRVQEWEREFDNFEANGKLPNLEFVRVMHDHTGNFGTAIAGVNTPESQTADNDYAVGLIVARVAKSKRYRGNTLVFVVEDDSQDGPDHVDAHRSIAFVAGPYVRQGAVVSKRYTTVSMVATIVDILGMDHLGTFDATDEPMLEVFDKKNARWDFQAIVPEILRTTQLPVPLEQTGRKAPKDKDPLWALYTAPRHDASYWAEKTRAFNFDVEDRLDSSRYNLILWQGVVGDKVPYPSARNGQDLSREREKLLAQFRTERLRIRGEEAAGGEE
ncbi:MAG TPA: beta-propeller fold lactonase family protein [Vicinamibacteria bacterium]|nr:beta-propeller fold lactonase family protein [Vicinamibacteria bacterium]